MSIIENKEIAIIGGGRGGIAVDRLLQLQGADVTYLIGLIYLRIR